MHPLRCYVCFVDSSADKGDVTGGSFSEDGGPAGGAETRSPTAIPDAAAGGPLEREAVRAGGVVARGLLQRLRLSQDVQRGKGS